MRGTILFILVLFGFTPVLGQGETGQIKLVTGYPCPDFKLSGMEDFRLKEARIKDFSGKWLILDFWDKNCMACVKSFPLVNELQGKYSNKIQYVLIGKQDKEGLIEKIYEKFRQRLDLRIAHTFDSLLFKRIGIASSPTIVVIDPKGVVYGMTNSLNRNEVAALLAGKQPQLNSPYLPGAPELAKHRLTDMDDRRDERPLYKSALNKWDATIYGSSGRRISAENGYYEAIGRSVLDLYKIAYLGQDGLDVRDSLNGKISDQLQVEISNPESLLGSENGNELYCYRVMVPPDKSNKQEIMRVMRNDLKTYFGYEVSIEDRNMPYWKLTATEQARKKLKTSGVTRLPQGRVDTGFVAGNIPVKKLLSYFLLVKFDLPIVDETGIDSNIDITMNCLLTEQEELRKGLKANGLDMVRGKKKMKVVVIRDPKQSVSF